MEEFLQMFAAIVEVNEVDASHELKSFQLLDSLGILSVIAMLDARYGVTVSTADINRMNTAGDLWRHVQCTIDSRTTHTRLGKSHSTEGLI